MPQYCAVPLCRESKRGHKFPRDKEVARQWLVAIGRESYNPSKYARVCYKHFNPDDYAAHKEPASDNPAPPKLKPQAVPSLFNWEPEIEEKKEIKRKRVQRNKNNNKSNENHSNTMNIKCSEPYTVTDDSSQELELVIDTNPKMIDIAVQCSLCKC